MARKPKNSETMLEVQEETPESSVVSTNFSETAYGLFKDAKSGEWVVTELSYDPVTLKVKDEVKLIPSGDNTRAVGMERFRITVGRHLFNKTGE